MTVSTGTEVSDVVGRDQSGERITVDFESPTVLFFYPEDGTPGCTEEARQFNRELTTYRETGVTPVGISTDTVEDHREFASDLGLGFSILADSDGAITEQFDVDLREGRAKRTTVVVVDGRVHRVYTGVNPDGHARTVLMDLIEDGIVELPEP